MANSYGNRNGSNGNGMGMSRRSPSRRTRSGRSSNRSGNFRAPQRMSNVNTGRRFSTSRPTGASRSFIIANGTNSAGVQQWLQCEGQTVTSTCKDVTDAYNISLYSGNSYKQR